MRWKGSEMRKLLLVGIAVTAITASVTFAQTTTPASPPVAGKMTPKTAPKTTMPTKPRTAESLECSKQADANGLHGKPRRAFKKDLMKKV
jgi:hypothetical protein